MNDAADAEGLCEWGRPHMRFVPVKTVDEQAALMLISVRTRLIPTAPNSPTQTRGYANEFRCLSSQGGLAHIPLLLERIQADGTVPELAQELFMSQAEEYAQLEKEDCGCGGQSKGMAA